MVDMMYFVVDDWSFIFLLFSALTYVFYLFAKTDSDVSLASKKPYACGLSIDPDKEKVPSPSFYKTVVSVFHMGAIKKMHKDDLSTYLLWMLSGVVFVSVYLLIFNL
ncbi:MAG: hypothetical protein KAI18_00105 [Candidatus Aenigmarchaeota archaeon]|nr:hypothetical protein [Candidatus Aenigmarchaeota archaeon]